MEMNGGPGFQKRSTEANGETGEENLIFFFVTCLLRSPFLGVRISYISPSRLLPRRREFTRYFPAEVWWHRHPAACLGSRSIARVSRKAEACGAMAGWPQGCWCCARVRVRRAAGVPIAFDASRAATTKSSKLMADLSEPAGDFPHRTTSSPTKPSTCRRCNAGVDGRGLHRRRPRAELQLHRPAPAGDGVHRRHQSRNRGVHLLYKALFESAGDRAEFVSRLFSRRRPDGLGPETSAQELPAAVRAAAR